MIDIADGLNSNVQFEKLINFSAEFNLENSETEDHQLLIGPKAS